MLSPNMLFMTPTEMIMPSISMVVKTIVTMEQLFQLRSLHMVREVRGMRERRVGKAPRADREVDNGRKEREL